MDTSPKGKMSGIATFESGGYEFTEWVEIRVESKEQKDKLLRELAKAHVPTEEIPEGFRVYS
jgi:hypothetical protein